MTVTYKGITQTIDPHQPNLRKSHQLFFLKVRDTAFESRDSGVSIHTPHRMIYSRIEKKWIEMEEREEFCVYSGQIAPIGTYRSSSVAMTPIGTYLLNTP